VSTELILLVEDDDALRGAFRRVLEKLSYSVAEASGVRDAERLLGELPVDAAVLDYRLADGTGLDVLPMLQARVPRVPSVILTGHGSVALAVEALQRGADHFLDKPVEIPALGAIVGRLVALGRDERRKLAASKRPSRDKHDPFIGSSAAIQKLAADARRIAASNATVLLQGETGSGKGVIAAWLHEYSSRRSEPFVDLNCSAFAGELVESELFGHRKGAFTGAVSDKPGLLEVAHGGTVFLDEIGDLGLQTQPKLLKALEERRIRRVGDVSDRAIDVRLVAATNKNLAQAVEEGWFREDLYYRVNTVPLDVPALRDRKEDIPVLAHRLLDTIAAEMGRLAVSLSSACIGTLSAHSWPGNIRELKNVLERAVLLSDRDVLRPEDLQFGRVASSEPLLPESLALEGVECRHIALVLRLTEGNIAEAARRLEVPRSTLYERIARHGIDMSEIRT
jgi:DNA-binding NtrC family response regulator